MIEQPSTDRRLAERFTEDPRDDDSSAEAAPLCLTPGESIVATVLVERHPVLAGRVLVTGELADGSPFESWVASLRALVLRSGDRVLLQQPSNQASPVVLAVLESPVADRQARREIAGNVTMRADESIRVRDADGRPLLDVTASADGPVLTLHAPVTALDMPGTFRLTADAVAIAARQGELTLDASGDINVTGEQINLN